jgi:RNA polymerase sigma factor (sigma-70 family)
VRAYGGLVWAVARRAGLSQEDAADVFQTVWRIAVEDLPRLRRRGSFGAWIGRTTHFQAMRVRRGYAITRKVLARGPAGEMSHEPPGEELERLERRVRVARGLESVGERCRELLRLLYYEDPTPAYAAIADRMGMRIGSVGPTRARCLERLERALGEERDEI